MKPILLLLTFVLFGCAVQPTPTTSVNSDWLQFGLQQGERGLLKLSVEKLATSDELYLAYSDGYEQGRAMYCQQNAYILGVIGKPYLGVCDKDNVFFQQDYISGRQSTAGRF
ncbi:DUF2799 domain-containing protein [Vibrio aestuarianus]|uniref:DUF2799 domain-containing protein n=1 Tax=Vibrio aestuarianus TaxID=28171 RepID=A0A9X4FDW5_9VIBR|nr:MULTISPECIES: DUF2799 domain-containing protein [Vibrio]MDE1210759.1 DUF2799 domain-containing protein [Vibrio aestuarianus]MDE1223050.1 DUF2799 domain-containing protein [Vibrio aestuarianus]MDE1310100.1 DUF2799 domain-containing protein [Vibrio aestuarianus]MDE1334906.1 DUF2799 domain-containing protein [Vibrio aestuarianus]MDE1348801.1 DUF2799 domain-containing protein [Vibrio aestuarianus]